MFYNTLPLQDWTAIDDCNTALRALQNPALFTSEHYKQAAIAVVAGIAIRVAIAIPVRLERVIWKDFGNRY